MHMSFLWSSKLSTHTWQNTFCFCWKKECKECCPNRWSSLLSVLPLSSPLLSPLLSPLQVITPDMKEFLLHLKEKVVIGIVGGSDLVKMEEQMGGDGGEGVSREERVRGGRGEEVRGKEEWDE